MDKNTNREHISDEALPCLLNFTLIGYGAISIIAQIVLLRELLSIFYGNELSMGIVLGIWLFWTAAGSGILAHYVNSVKCKFRFFVYAQLIWTILFAFTLYAGRTGFFVLGRSPGEITGFLPIQLSPFVILCPFCLTSGFLYTLGCTIYSERIKNPTLAIGKVYLLEAIGAGLGGTVVSFILIKLLTPFQIAFVLFLLSGCFLFFYHALQPGKNSKSQISVRLFILLISSLLALFAFSKLDTHSLHLHWRNFNLQRMEYSIYGSVALTKLEDSYSVYENGLLMFTIPDLFSAEESVHFALLEHPQPKRVLLIGGGISGSLQQILQHPDIEKLDYVELDPTIVALGQSILSSEEKAALTDPRLRIHYMDGRFFVKTTNSNYDVVIVNLPDPHTTLINRFYTREFYAEIAKILTAGGILTFSVTSSENVISADLSQFLSCLYKTLRESFVDIILIPGNTCHFIACTHKNVLTENADTLIERLKSRNIKTKYVREYYLPYRMSPERMEYIRSQIQISDEIEINKDFKPIAYYFDMVLWGSYFSKSFRNVFIKLSEIGFTGYVALIGLLFLISLGIRLLPKFKLLRCKFGIFLSVFAVGYSEIGLEVILIVAFQVLYGYAYYQLALMVTGYMLGLSLGSWLSNRRRGSGKNSLAEFRICQLLMTLFPAAVPGIIILLAKYSSQLGHTILMQFIFMLLVSFAGFIGGYQFPIANELHLKSGKGIAKAAGTIYGLDLAGSCLGAMLTSAVLIPLFGIHLTLLSFGLLNFVALVNILWNEGFQ